MTITVISLDYDRCAEILRDNYIGNPLHNFFIQEILNRIPPDTDQVYIVCGSKRQSLPFDTWAETINKNGLAFETLRKFAETYGFQFLEQVRLFQNDSKEIVDKLMKQYQDNLNPEYIMQNLSIEAIRLDLFHWFGENIAEASIRELFKNDDGDDCLIKTAIAEYHMKYFAENFPNEDVEYFFLDDMEKYVDAVGLNAKRFPKVYPHFIHAPSELLKAHAEKFYPETILLNMTPRFFSNKRSREAEMVQENKKRKVEPPAQLQMGGGN